MRKYLTMVVLLFMSISMFAQQHSVKGTVVDQNGQPIIGMTVMEQGTQNGTTTDIDGNYQITLSSGGAVLEFTALGYSTVVEQVNNRAVIDVESAEEAMVLDAVVAIGYGSVRKKDLTTAVSTVSTEDMKLRPVTEASGFIQGKVAGVTVQQTSGLPGSGMTVRVRGASSIASSNDPLYVVDGVPVGTGNYAIAYLSPQDIETMQILKDASSAAIYGSRAANGVVLITTKQGKKSRGPQVSLNASVGLANVAKTYDVLNVAEYKELMDELGMVNLPDGLKDETDWFEETYKTGINQNYQLSVSNATDNMRYYISGGYSDEQGILPVAFNKRFNVKASFDSDLYDWLNVGANVAYSHYKNNGIISGTGSNRAGVVLSVINTPTYAKPWSETNPNWYWTEFYGANLTTPSENLARTENNYSQTDRLLLTGYAQINFTKNFKFKSTVSMDRRWVHSYSFLDPIKTSYGRTQHGEASSSRSDDMRMVYDNIFTYNNSWNAKHNFEAMAGTSATTSRWENLSGSRSHFSPDYNNAIFGINGGNKGGLRGQSQGFAKWAIMSYLARVSYNFDSKYYVTVNFRADGSSKLAPGNRWGYFPSASVAWRISGEDFMKDVTWINDLKIRAGWGQQGNQSGLADYAWVQQYNTNYYDWTKTEFADATPTLGGKSNIGNKDLTWETTTQTNIGIDWSMFNSRLIVTLDGYYKYTKDLLMNVPLPSPYPSIYRNEGEMSNWGLELAINSVNIEKDDWRWTTDFNISMNRNKLEKLNLQQVYYYTQTSEALSEYVVRMTPGQPLSQFWGYTAKGVDPETGSPTWEKIEEDGTVTLTKTYAEATYQNVGKSSPLFQGGVSTYLRWKGLSLNATGAFVYGNKIYNSARVSMDSDGAYTDYNMMSHDNGLGWTRWEKPGDIPTHPQPKMNGNNDAHMLSTRYLEDGSYFRLKNVTLSYDFPQAWMKKAKMQGLKGYVSGDNLVTVSKFSGMDPEIDTEDGTYDTNYPVPMTVVGGIQITF